MAWRWKSLTRLDESLRSTNVLSQDYKDSIIGLAILTGNEAYNEGFKEGRRKAEATDRSALDAAYARVADAEERVYKAEKRLPKHGSFDVYYKGSDMRGMPLRASQRSTVVASTPLAAAISAARRSEHTSPLTYYQVVGLDPEGSRSFEREPMRIWTFEIRKAHDNEREDFTTTTSRHGRYVIRESF